MAPQSLCTTTATPRKASADETVKAVKAAGGDAFAIQGDLTKVPAVAELFDEAVKRFGRVDIAINTVGKVLKKPIVETTEEDYDSMFATTLKRRTSSSGKRRST